MFANARRVFDAGLKKKVTPYEMGKDVAPGLQAVEHRSATRRATPRTCCRPVPTRCSSSPTSPTIPALFVTNPGWHPDVRPGSGDGREATRRKVYDMLVADKMRVQGFHYPFPANGYVEKDGNGYRLVPAPWSPVI